MSEAGAWVEYWKRKPPAEGRGCVPNGATAVQQAQVRLWTEAVRPLARNASVLDLATGDGAVLAMMRKARGDLKLVGVDSSPDLPKGPAGVALRAGVRMEQLPFPDRRFDLVSSQFGIEYGDVAATAREVVRVLRSGGWLAFLIHRAEGPIVAHNRGRAEALRWASLESGLLDEARAFLRLRSGGKMPVPARFGDAVNEARRLFPDQSVAAEFAEAVRRTLVMSGSEPASRTMAVLDELAARAAGELVRIAALLRAARDTAGIADLSRVLEDAGISLAQPSLVSESSACEPFAWFMQGRR